MIEPSAGTQRTCEDSSQSLSSPETGRFQDVFLRRLKRLVALKSDLPAGASPETRKLVDLALYSTYQDCVALCVEDRARSLLGRPR